jgi:hypothetical protein
MGRGSTVVARLFLDELRAEALASEVAAPLANSLPRGRDATAHRRIRQ